MDLPRREDAPNVPQSPGQGVSPQSDLQILQNQRQLLPAQSQNTTMIDRPRRSLKSTPKILDSKDIERKVKNNDRKDIEQKAESNDESPSQAPVRQSEFRYTDRQHEVLRNVATTGVGGLNPDKTTIQALAKEINMDEKKVAKYFSNCRAGRYAWTKNLKLGHITSPNTNDDEASNKNMKRSRPSYSDFFGTGNNGGPSSSSKLLEPEPEPEPKKLKKYLTSSLLADSVAYSTEPLPFGLTLELDGTVLRSDGSVWTRNVASLSADGEKVYKNYKKRVDTPASVGQSTGPVADSTSSMGHSTEVRDAKAGSSSAMAPPVDAVPDATTRNGITGKIATLENEIAAFNEEKNALDAVHARTEAKYEKIQGQIAALMEERDEIERSMAENRGKVDMVNKNITGAEVSKKLLEQTRSLF